MKLINLKIEELYETYDYNVDFNSDVTFLYGLNGCGKTTILNITEAIITGKLFKLFSYSFKKIKLSYTEHPNLEHIKHISIDKSEANKLLIYFNSSKPKTIRNLSNEHLRFSEKNNREANIAILYFDEYNFLHKIKETFNYVYLPLNRLTLSYDYEDSRERYIIRRRHRFITDEMEETEDEDITLSKVQSIIFKYHSKMTSNISIHSDIFRNQILKSLLAINQQDVIKIMTNELKAKNSRESVQQTKNGYIKILNELKLLTLKEEKNYTDFFENFNNQLDTVKNADNKLGINLVVNFFQISKIQELLKIANAFEDKKSTERRHLDTFIETMNSFLDKGSDGKKINVDSMGRVYFTTYHNPNTKISINKLSSGEKQLLTFFTCLIFAIDDTTSGIFVVDEPELSLHLSWQKLFVEKTLEINKNIQLIFATHSPEFIGKRRDRMFKLEKDISTKSRNNG